jgi:predicted NUDIX family NTP pyrophosphohydrolase
MKKSAGFVLYHFKKSQLEVFLVHLGGPFWKIKMRGDGLYQKVNMKKAKIHLK